MEKQHVHAALAYRNDIKMDMHVKEQYEQAAWTSSMYMQHGQRTISMQH
jgi:hypothetical protein